MRAGLKSGQSTARSGRIYTFSDINGAMIGEAEATADHVR